MTNKTSGHQFLILGILLAVIFWMTDTLVHHIFFDEKLELIPNTINELWMRTTIIVLLIIFGAYVDHHNRILLSQEQEKLQIYKATVHSTQHILNNLLNQMQLIRLEMENPGQYKEELKKTFESCFKEGKSLVERLSTVNALTPEEIIRSVNPEHMAN
ncbi:MAG: hypothetical protein OEZ39_06025 [Gammaproteobacteria bacterium]|nr:hypothetical protein [Gammaproteobacteria bacterium]MDH5651412.1 hypothetical protein [Gammaproteobacteria bacterium]